MTESLAAFVYWVAILELSVAFAVVAVINVLGMLKLSEWGYGQYIDWRIKILEHSQRFQKPPTPPASSPDHSHRNKFPVDKETVEHYSSQSDHVGSIVGL